MSNLRSGDGPCVRTINDPPKEVVDMLGSVFTGRTTPREAYCAAYVTYLRMKAMKVAEDVTNGGFMNYANLPHAFIGRMACGYFWCWCWC